MKTSLRLCSSISSFPWVPLFVSAAKQAVFRAERKEERKGRKGETHNTSHSTYRTSFSNIAQGVPLQTEERGKENTNTTWGWGRCTWHNQAHPSPSLPRQTINPNEFISCALPFHLCSFINKQAGKQATNKHRPECKKDQRDTSYIQTYIRDKKETARITMLSNTAGASDPHSHGHAHHLQPTVHAHSSSQVHHHQPQHVPIQPSDHHHHHHHHHSHHRQDEVCLEPELRQPNLLDLRTYNGNLFSSDRRKRGVQNSEPRTLQRTRSISFIRRDTMVNMPLFV